MPDIVRELALSGFLLRAYGFKNQEIYNILESKAFDLSMFQPTSGAATQTAKSSASKNLNKHLFTDKARKRIGGKRGAPSWLPAGTNLGDYLSQSLGFGDEEDLDSFTLNTVGSLMSAAGKTMGILTAAKAPQRNLTQTADWEWTEDSALMAGGPIDEHSMSGAIDIIKGGNNFDLASMVVGGSSTPSILIPVNIPSPPPPTPSTTPTPPTPTVVDDDDDDDPATVNPPSPTIPDDDDDDDDDVDVDDLLRGIASGHKLLSPARPTPPISDLPEPSKATRRLNKNTWDLRSARRDQSVFAPHETSDSPGVFYPAVEPIYILLSPEFNNGVIPQKDVSIKDNSKVISLDGNYDGTARPMMLVLEANKQPYFYLTDDVGSIYGDPYFLKMNLKADATDVGTPLSTKTCICTGLEIQWSDPADETTASVPEKIRFALRTSQRQTVVQKYILQQDTHQGAYKFLAPPSGGNNNFALTMEELVTQRGSPHFTNIAHELRQEVAGGYASATYDESEDLLLPIGDSIPSSVLAGSFESGASADVLVYGVPDFGMAGVRMDPDGDFIFEESLIFANQGVQVFTTVDQYENPNISPIIQGRFLANLPVDWENESKEVWTAANPPNMSLRLQLQFRDSSSTVSEYSGINPTDDKAPRVQTIYIPGDIPEKIFPLGLDKDQWTMNKIEAYPLDANAVYERVRVTFVNADGEESHVEIPDKTDRFVGTVMTSTGNQSTMFGEACLVEMEGERGYIVYEVHSEYTTKEWMQLINEARVVTRASDMNNIIAAPTGNVPGVKQLIWSEGRTLNVLMLKPGSTDEFIHLTIVTEQAGIGE